MTGFDPILVRYGLKTKYIPVPKICGHKSDSPTLIAIRFGAQSLKGRDGVTPRRHFAHNDLRAHHSLRKLNVHKILKIKGSRRSQKKL